MAIYGYIPRIAHHINRLRENHIDTLYLYNELFNKYIDEV